MPYWDINISIREDCKPLINFHELQWESQSEQLWEEKSQLILFIVKANYWLMHNEVF